MHATGACLQYRTTQAQTADGGELIVMLYQGAIKFLGRAIEALRAGSIQEAHENILRAEDIIAELLASLDPGAGEMALNLARIYEFMYQRLVQANVRKDPEIVEEVAGLLRELLPAWQQAARQARASRLQAREPAGSRLCGVAG